MSGPEHHDVDRRYVIAAFVLILAVAAWWRLTGLANPGLWLDEILGVRGIGPEHGPLYYATMRATTGAQPDEFLTRLPFALAGILGVAAACAAGRAASGPWLGLAAGAFVATSPIHLYYSREARPYAILLLCGFVGLLAVAHLVRRWERPWWWLAVLAAAIGTALFTSANGIFVAGSLVVAAVWTRPGLRIHALWLGIVAALAAASVLTVRAIYPPGTTAAALPAWEDVRAAIVPVFGPMVSGHLEQPAMRPASWLGLSFALCGALAIGWRTPRVALALSGAAVAGLVLPVAAMLWLQHFISARYALAMFPAFALLIAGPAALLDRLDGPWRRDGRWLVAAAALALAVLGSLQSDARRVALTEKADWRKVGALVAERSRPGDLVVVSNDWSSICLEYYLPPAGPEARRVVNVHERLDDAQRVLAAEPRAILVSGGHHFTNWDVPRWMSGFPRIWQSGREDIALSFYPDRRTYLTSAITAGEVAADEARLRTMLRSRIDMTVNARAFLIEGWHDAEVYRRDTPFRWADRRAVAYLPIASRWPTVLTTKVRPHPRLIDRRLDVLINGVLVSTTVLTDEWTEVRVALPRDRLRAGANLIELRTSEPPVPYDRGAKAVQGIELR